MRNMNNNEIGMSDALSSYFGESIEKSSENFVTSDSCYDDEEENRFGSFFGLDMHESIAWWCQGIENLEESTYEDIEVINEAMLKLDDPLWSSSLQHIYGPLDQGNSWLEASCGDEDYNPYAQLMSWQDLPPCFSASRKEIPITLVLDLDETLVHSSFERCEDADFSFVIHSEKCVQTVFVRQRPYLQMFLEAVSSMFDVVIFTAGHSIYAGSLVDILDPNRNLIGQRVYRDSCVINNGRYLKDLTILGRDLAKIAIVDNTPQVYKLQVENGIPIESWFGDQSDTALISLFFFLQTLVGAEDVRPLIQNKYGKHEP